MPPRARECEVCTVTYKPTYTKQRTCGRDCGWKLKVREGKTPAPKGQMRTVEALCLQCGGTFSYEAGAHAWRLFCDQQCIDAHNAAYAAAQVEARKRVCAGCDVRFTPHHGSQVFCAKPCARRLRKRRDGNHRQRARRYGVRYEPVNPKYIYNRDAWRCGICRKTINKRLAYPHLMSPSIDHILPMAHGGDHVVANLQAAHWICNALKSDGTTTHGEQLMLIG